MENMIKDYSDFDKPEVLLSLFHPGADDGCYSPVDKSGELMIPVDNDVFIGARFFYAQKDAPTLLFFHGNGEIVSDYNDIGHIYNKIGINFFPVDYRGYGKSTGMPTVSNMMKDSHAIFEFAERYLKDNGFSAPLIIMGRSLGSASALELAENYGNRVNGLIIESGFAHALPLMQLLGIDVVGLGLREEKGFMNLEKIRKYMGPTLIIHAELDHIIPFSDGEELFKASPCAEKLFLKIPDENHNTIFNGMELYMSAVKKFVERVVK